jgi:hypothetical protein
LKRKNQDNNCGSPPFGWRKAIIQRLFPDKARSNALNRCFSPRKTVLATPRKRKRYNLANNLMRKTTNLDILGSFTFISEKALITGCLLGAYIVTQFYQNETGVSRN